MAQEPFEGEPPRRLTPEEIHVILNAAEAICQRHHLTPAEVSIISAAWSYLAYRELAECKGSFYELVCGVENRVN